MSLEDLSRLCEERKFATSGEGFKSFTLELADRRIRKKADVLPLVDCLEKVFSIRYFDELEPVVVWSDSIGHLGSEDTFYTDWKDTYMLGVFYRKDVYGQDQLSHVFIRSFQGYRGPLDEWNQDISYPADTRRYSVCAILPADHESTPRERRDPHNHAVTKYLHRDFVALGLDFAKIRQLVMQV